MALSYTTLRDIPYLRDYATAAKREQDTKPIRGDANNTKPLGKRNQKWRSIKREENGDICAYEGSSVLVRYRPNGDILIYDCAYWNKASQNEVIGELLLLHVETYQNAMWVNIDGGKFKLRASPKAKWDSNRNDWVYPEGSIIPENIFRRDEQGTLHYTNPPGIVRHRIRRKEMRAVREQYAAFKLSMSAMVKLLGDEPVPTQNYIETFNIPEDDANRHYWQWRNHLPTPVGDKGFKHEHAAEMCALMLSSDPADQFKAQLWLTITRWNITTEGWEQAMDRAIMMHHHAEVLEQFEAADGVKAKDNYAWAIPPA